MSGVAIETVGSVGYLTLTRAETLNAITQEMVDELHQGLQQHEDNDKIDVIVLRSSSQRAFCAGGDMKRIRQYVLDDDRSSIEHFFTSEYALNQAIADCSKPYISVIDGVAMGGGLGLSVHGQFVVVTENALMAMPESRIGFFPDVGASHFLQDLPFNCGTWLALTAAPVKAQHAVQAGLATHHIKREQLANLFDQLENLNKQNGNPPATVQQCLNQLSSAEVDEEYDQVLQLRQKWFASNDVEEIQTQLAHASANNDDAKKLLELMKKGSPHSYAITLSLFKKTTGLPLNECLAIELELSMLAAFHPDLAEGVRAVLVDKDHKANWQ